MSTPTAPLPPAASAALARVERALFCPESESVVTVLPPEVVRAVAVFETAAVHAVQLAALAESGDMTDLDADSLAAAEDLMAGARATLAEAGALHLIGAA
jgi:hypothetical protein